MTTLITIASVAVAALWIWAVVVCIRELVRRQDLNQSKRYAWLIILLVVPILGVLLYVVIEGGPWRGRGAAVDAGK